MSQIYIENVGTGEAACSELMYVMIIAQKKTYHIYILGDRNTIKQAYCRQGPRSQTLLAGGVASIDGFKVDRYLEINFSIFSNSSNYPT